MCCICMLVMMDSVAYCLKGWTVIRCYNGDCMHYTQPETGRNSRIKALAIDLCT